MTALLLGFVLTLPAVVGAPAPVTKEYQVKAAFLYNFTKFIDWPEQRFSSATAAIEIAIFGPNRFGDELQKIVAGRKVNGRPIVVKSVDSWAEAQDAQLVFVTDPRGDAWTENLARLHQRHVVTVSDVPGFFEAGGIIGFELADDKVRFVINQDAAERAGLKISAQLLKLATRVRRPGEGAR